MPIDSNLLERLLHEEEGRALRSISSEISMRLKERATRPRTNYSRTSSLLLMLGAGQLRTC